MNSSYFTETGYYFASWDVPDEASIPGSSTSYAVQVSFSKAFVK